MSETPRLSCLEQSIYILENEVQEAKQILSEGVFQRERGGLMELVKEGEYS
jgi:hypothetical protein